MAEVGYATLAIIPSFRGFRTQMERGTSAQMAAAGRSAGTKFGSGFKSAIRAGGVLGGLGAAFGIAGFIKDSVELEAQFGKTMSQIRVATNAPVKELARLDALAIKLGKDTVFSANEASGAMLELAKNGIKPAIIEGGALKAALTLAAAGSVDLTEAAQTMGNSLNAFNLKGKSARRVASALAGSANASSASVGDLSYALAQVGLSANSVGFSIQETTALLAAFSNAGIQGSDAGTSLKVMLDRLQPTTTRAEAAMRGLGLVTEQGKNLFIDRNGQFVDAVRMAELLQKGTESLTQAEAKRQLTQAFGQDAQRAALVLAKEGADGIRDLTAATSDQGAAQAMAKANMEGTAGAIERLKGSWETAKLQFGKFIAPAAVEILDRFAQGIEDAGPKVGKFGGWIEDEAVPAIKAFVNAAKPAVKLTGKLIEGFNDLPAGLKTALAGGAIGGLALSKLPKGVNPLSGSTGSILSKARPIPVFVTNPGGVGGGAGSAAKGGAVATVTAAAARFASSAGRLLTKFGPVLPAAGALGNDQVKRTALKPEDVLSDDDLAKMGLYTKKIDLANDAFVKVRNRVDQGRESVRLFNASIDGLPGGLSIPVRTPGLPLAHRLVREYGEYLQDIPREVVTDFITNRNDKNEGQLDRFGGFRANGGPVEAGRAYVVGERRPELFVPNQSGTIVPSVGGSGVTVNIGQVVAQDYRDFMQQTQRRARVQSGGGVNF